MNNSHLELSTLYIHNRENQVNFRSNMYCSKYKTINSIDILEPFFVNKYLASLKQEQLHCNILMLSVLDFQSV